MSIFISSVQSAGLPKILPKRHTSALYALIGGEVAIMEPIVAVFLAWVRHAATLLASCLLRRIFVCVACSR